MTKWNGKILLFSRTNSFPEVGHFPSSFTPSEFYTNFIAYDMQKTKGLLQAFFDGRQKTEFAFC
jgi:hypothetical protein